MGLVNFFKVLHDNKNSLIEDSSETHDQFQNFNQADFSQAQLIDSSKCKQRSLQYTAQRLDDTRKSHEWKNALRHTLSTHPFPMIGVVSLMLCFYLTFGGLVFKYLEQDYHIEKCDLANYKLNTKFINILKHMEDTEKSELREMFHVFQILKESGASVEVLEKEVHTISNDSSKNTIQDNAHEVAVNQCLRKTKFKVNCPLKWHFFDSVLFSLVTITTIGYGHQVPKTHHGKGGNIFQVELL